MTTSSEPLQAIARNNIDLAGSGVSLTQDPGDEIQEGSASVLPSVKLSTKKKEALSQVPCKFFRSNGCSAGNACPFAHITPGEGQGKAICQWFLKGSCRFGHKCALAHILPGQPISMDRKNKRAAQHVQQQQYIPHQQHALPQLRQQVDPFGIAAESSRKNLSHIGDHPGQPALRSFQYNTSGSMHDASIGGSSQQQSGYVQRPSQATYSNYNREAELLFGVPDDLQEAYPQQDLNGAQGVQHTGATSSDRDWQGRMLQNVVINEPLSERQYNDGNLLSSSKAFGTSPFSNPGSQSVFYSHREPTSGHTEQANSTSNMDIIRQGAECWKEIGKAEEDNRDEINEEDFLPSSLSDLLTPAELQRRSKGGLARSTLHFSPQSMPASSTDDAIQGNKHIDAVYSREVPHQSADATSLIPLRAQSNGNENIFGTSNTSAGFLTSTSRRGLANVVPAGNDSIASSAASFGSSSPTAFHHAAGQSLPQGLAAGLSRLHLQRLENGHERNRPIRTSQLATSPSTTSIWSQQKSNHNHHLSSSSSKLSEGLGPIAPSSFFAHKTPLHLSSSHRSSGHANSTPQSPEVNQQHQNNAFFSTSVNGSAGISSSPNAHASAQSLQGGKGAGVTIPTESNATSIEHLQGVKVNASHPGVQRVRSSHHGVGSPLAIPTHAEEVEEAIFELE